MTKLKGVVSMTTWTDQDCGCSRSDDGWWIVSLSCETHAYTIPPADRQGASSYGHSVAYGPFKPKRVRIKLTPRSVIDEEIAIENHTIVNIERRIGRHG